MGHLAEVRTRSRSRTPQAPVICAYATFAISDCEFSAAQVAEGRQLVEYPDGVTVAQATTCADSSGLGIEKLESNFAAVSPDLVAGYSAEPGETASQIAGNYEATIEGLFAELTEASGVLYAYPGTAPVHRMVTVVDPVSVPPPVVPAAPCTYDWWPVVGRIQVGPAPNYPGKRRVFQEFQWDDRTLLGLKGCRENITIEPDAVADDSDSLTYLGNRLHGKYISDLPHSYYDDRRLDFGGTTSWTIGSADAQKIVAGRTYRTLIRTYPGNASTDRMRVRFQNGVRFFNCFSSICVFAADSLSDHWATPWFDVPGSRVW